MPPSPVGQPQLPPAMKVTGSTVERGTRLFFSCWTSACTAHWPSSRIGCAIVDSTGQVELRSRVPSKETIATSSGTSRPMRRHADSTPIACSSLCTNSAVGRSRCVSRSAASSAAATRLKPLEARCRSVPPRRVSRIARRHPAMRSCTDDNDCGPDTQCT